MDTVAGWIRLVWGDTLFLTKHPHPVGKVCREYCSKLRVKGGKANYLIQESGARGRAKNIFMLDLIRTKHQILVPKK